jgi:hypothetical protein
MGKGRTFTLLPQFDRVVETLLNSPWLSELDSCNAKVKAFFERHLSTSQHNSHVW